MGVFTSSGLSVSAWSSRVIYSRTSPTRTVRPSLSASLSLSLPFPVVSSLSCASPSSFPSPQRSCRRRPADRRGAARRSSCVVLGCLLGPARPGSRSCGRNGSSGRDATMSGGEVVCQGWLRKSPPEKKLKRYVSVSSGSAGSPACRKRPSPLLATLHGVFGLVCPGSLRASPLPFLALNPYGS